ncbi:MAG: leucyl aminopeptidase [Rhodospirillaceae bacterium]|jgi:leucyl aminopeptidase|nr:leucyl aminopeptidase [Rhodospirillaceae bacterium]MBT5244200.1 leucyl aminopeptidase [Rhodospirillaceae bacterium]MBT5561725.1 leucyl aminopeptidase [Rhodospirillaceae bacterium]MBT6243164.1 leucyl aminopeptidase [Rhodospirillaceae bacterium]MBT7137443.1 leucyl aminopeptidase [Rhodospirillaceae bacterium]
MKITFTNPGLPKTGVVVVGVLDGRKLTDSAKALDKMMSGGLVRAIKASRFKGGRTSSLPLLAPGGTGFTRILLVGMGKAKAIDAKAMQGLGGEIYAALSTKGHATVQVMVDAIEKCAMKPDQMAAEMALGARLRSYRFDKYRTKEKPESKPSLKALKIACAGATRARKAFAPMDKVASGVFMTRDLVSEPANVLYPETLAKQAQSLSKLGVKVEVLGEVQMRKLGMGALLGVGQGSIRESKMVVMRWNGKKGKAKSDAPVAFVGKGVTFDTGGISIKPSGGMEDMKWDMGGSGVVIGLMKALAGRKANANVVGVVGLVENMPSGAAQRPGDIVTSMSGQTIEVLNTDAEGRLVLADALWYTKERFKPKFMVDLATLTGAIIICLGNEKAGMFSNDDKLSGQLSDAGEAVGESVWRLPMGDNYDKMLNCDAADMKNISGGRGAGSITAAQFLKRFVDKTPWAHLDIAGVTWSSKASSTTPKGGTAFGVRLLDRLVADHYEK